MYARWWMVNQSNLKLVELKLWLQLMLDVWHKILLNAAVSPVLHRPPEFYLFVDVYGALVG